MQSPADACSLLKKEKRDDYPSERGFRGDFHKFRELVEFVGDFKEKGQVDMEFQLWETCSDHLKSQVSEATWNAWFAGIKAEEFTQDRLTLSIPSNLAKERLESRFLPLLTSVISESLGHDITLDLKVRESDHAFSLEHVEHVEAMVEITQPDDRFTFETFVTGPSNRFAHAAALSVAEAPGKSYNPLFIHGGAGLGKTHLLRAIENYVANNFPSKRIRYVSTETFMNEFVNALRSNTTTAFKRNFRECDVLLVDDVQFMEGKESLQEEFFYTFNTLYESSKQVVITSDRPPKALATIEERLQSRFLSGLITDVQPPELETRLAILRSKSDRDSLVVPDDVLIMIATHVKDNIRELEGALIRVSAYANLNSLTLTPELAQIALADILSSASTIHITPQMIIKATAEAFGFSVDEIRGQNRHRPLVNARQIGMYVTRELTDFSYPAIAKEFGGRDHTTVIHAVEKVGKEMREKRDIYEQVTDLIKKIKSGTY